MPDCCLAFFLISHCWASDITMTDGTNFSHYWDWARLLSFFFFPASTCIFFFFFLQSLTVIRTMYLPSLILCVPFIPASLVCAFSISLPPPFLTTFSPPNVSTWLSAHFQPKCQYPLTCPFNMYFCSVPLSFSHLLEFLSFVFFSFFFSINPSVY